MPDVRQMNRMRLSIRSLLILTLLIVVAAIGFVALRNSHGKSWTSGISQGSAADNPGYAIFVAEVEQLLADEGFIPCERPESIDDFRSVQGKWFRSKNHAELYAFTYSDSRYYTADVSVSVRGSMKDVPALRRYTEKLVVDFRNLWDDERHSLQNWPKNGAD